MRANVTRQDRTRKTREWVVSVDERSGGPEINHNEVLTVIGWAQQDVEARGEKVYDNSIRMHGQEDGSIVVSVEIETTEEFPA